MESSETVWPAAMVDAMNPEASELGSTATPNRRRREGGRGGRGNGGEEEEEHHHNPFLLGHASTSPKLQPRKEVSKARWDEVMGMGEVIEKKGSMWATTGVIRNGKLYCHIEEILFLAERGALLLSGPEDAILNIKDIYKKISEGKDGCCWETFQAYRHLKKLGYIVGRHGVPRTMKSSTSSFGSCSVQRTSESDGVHDLVGSTSIIRQFNDMQINQLKPTFDVYLPDSKFRKSSPGDPSFILSLCRDYPPSRAQVVNLEKKCCGIPLKFCFVDHGRVCFFTFERIELPILA